jgi:hypothetical protein
MASQYPTRSLIEGVGVPVARGNVASGSSLPIEAEPARPRRGSRTIIREVVTYSPQKLDGSRPHRGNCDASESRWIILDPAVLRWMCNGPQLCADTRLIRNTLSHEGL